MSQFDIGLQRLVNQHVTQPRFAHPHEVVQWLGAMQAQDYLGALWAIGLRTPDATEQSITQALAEKTIVRTWPMRGTLHFVAASDVRWMLELLTPRVVQRSKGRLAQLQLDAKTISASATVITNTLAGGKQLTRSELYAVLEQAQIATNGQRGIHILGQLAHQQLICFGTHVGKQPTFALFDEWVPDAKSLPRDQALATLALRYFTGHGPATVYDFMWWSGLTATDAREGLATVITQLGSERRGTHEYYFAQGTSVVPSVFDAFLLPPFDEFLLGYRDRSAVLDTQHTSLVNPSSNGIFNPITIIGGQVVGTWKRVLERDTVVISFSAFPTSSNEAHIPILTAAAERYGHFLGKTPQITFL